MRHAAPVVLLSLLAACDPTDDAAQSCARDFDCPVGQLCQVGTCADAAGAERTFGEAVIDVGGPSETWLVNVFALPTDAEVVTDPILFSLTNGEPAGALRPAPSRPAASYDPAWDARLRFESERHAKIDGLAADLAAGRRSLDRALPRQANSCACGGPEMCWQAGCTAQVDLTFADGSIISTDLVLVDDFSGPVAVNVLLDQDELASTGVAAAAASDFAATLARELALLGQSGHSGALDRDGDGRLTVVFTNRTTPTLTLDVVGFFLLEDYLPSGGSGNQADILWARVPDDVTITSELAVGTLVHEYAHLVSYATRVHARGSAALRETLWLDEGIAHLMEDLTGWGNSNIGAVAWALGNWSTAGFGNDVDSVVLRGQAYLLLRHMVDQAGSGDAASSATDAAGRTLVSGLLAGEARGWSHPEFAGADVGAMLLAVYATGRTDLLDSAHRADYLGTAAHLATNQTVGINTHDSRTDARGDLVSLDGPSLEDTLTAWGDPLTGEVVPSGSLYYELSGVPAGTITITGRGTAAADLRLQVERVQ